MKLKDYTKLKHGMKVRISIEGTVIEDAIISVDEDGKAYACQNVMDGCDAENKLGYKHSWNVRSTGGTRGMDHDWIEIIETNKTLMTTIIETVKNAIKGLSADEVLLRKNGLKDAEGDYTKTAADIIMEKLCKENESFLIEMAKKFEEESKK